jgi:hypothetical protein
MNSDRMFGRKPIRASSFLFAHSPVRNIEADTRYAHLDDGHVIEAAQRIGDLIERSISGS